MHIIEYNTHCIHILMCTLVRSKHKNHFDKVFFFFVPFFSIDTVVYDPPSKRFIIQNVNSRLFFSFFVELMLYIDWVAKSSFFFISPKFFEQTFFIMLSL